MTSQSHFCFHYTWCLTYIWNGKKMVQVQRFKTYTHTQRWQHFLSLVKKEFFLSNQYTFFPVLLLKVLSHFQFWILQRRIVVKAVALLGNILHGKIAKVSLSRLNKNGDVRKMKDLPTHTELHLLWYCYFAIFKLKINWCCFLKSYLSTDWQNHKGRTINIFCFLNLYHVPLCSTVSRIQKGIN